MRAAALAGRMHVQPTHFCWRVGVGWIAADLSSSRVAAVAHSERCERCTSSARVAGELLARQTDRPARRAQRGTQHAMRVCELAPTVTAAGTAASHPLLVTRCCQSTLDLTTHITAPRTYFHKRQLVAVTELPPPLSFVGLTSPSVFALCHRLLELLLRPPLSDPSLTLPCLLLLLLLPFLSFSPCRLSAW